MRKSLIAIALNVFQIYFRFFPQVGMSTVWHRIVRPHLAWRGMTVSSKTAFGATLRGPLNDLINQRLFFFGVWEPNITNFIRNALRPGDVAIDIGSNVGVHTLLAAKCVGPNGRVHAIEASPTIYQMLLRNLTNNSAQNVIPHNVACTESATTVTIFLHSGDNRGASTIQPGGDLSHLTEEAQVSGQPLGDIVPIADIERARLIKIDVEGAELGVLSGMKSILQHLPPEAEIIVEVSPAAPHALGDHAEKLLAILRDAGFKLYELQNDYSIESYIHPAPLRGPTALRTPVVAQVDVLASRHEY